MLYAGIGKFEFSERPACASFHHEMSTLPEIVKAADALPAEQQEVLLRRLNQNLAHRQAGSPSSEGWPVPPPDVPIEELRRIHAFIEAEFSQIDPNVW